MIYLKQTVQKLTRIDFVRFCIVGILGFSVNLLILTTLHSGLMMSIFIAQFIAAEIALFGNFILHHYWTYRHRIIKKKKRNLLVQFHITSWPAILGSTAIVGFLVSLGRFSSLFALVVSSVIALLWNYTWSKMVIWRETHESS